MARFGTPDRVLLRFADEPALLGEYLVARHLNGDVYVLVDSSRRPFRATLVVGALITEIVHWPLDAARLPARIRPVG